MFEVLDLRGLQSPSCPDPNRRRRYGDTFGDFTQGKGVNVKRRGCRLLELAAGFAIRKEIAERWTCGESLAMNEFTIFAMRGEQRSETANETV